MKDGFQPCCWDEQLPHPSCSQLGAGRTLPPAEVGQPVWERAAATQSFWSQERNGQKSGERQIQGKKRRPLKHCEEGESGEAENWVEEEEERQGRQWHAWKAQGTWSCSSQRGQIKGGAGQQQQQQEEANREGSTFQLSAQVLFLSPEEGASVKDQQPDGKEKPGSPRRTQFEREHKALGGKTESAARWVGASEIKKAGGDCTGNEARAGIKEEKPSGKEEGGGLPPQVNGAEMVQWAKERAGSRGNCPLLIMFLSPCCKLINAWRGENRAEKSPIRISKVWYLKYFWDSFINYPGSKIQIVFLVLLHMEGSQNRCQGHSSTWSWRNWFYYSRLKSMSQKKTVLKNISTHNVQLCETQI